MMRECIAISLSFSDTMVIVKAYRSKLNSFSGTSYREIERKARKHHAEIEKKTKRNVYIRSKYFKKDKIFLTVFWSHLNQKTRRDRKRRLKYYACAIDLLQNTTYDPEVKPNPNGKNELVYRFVGMTQNDEIFYVQVKEDKRTSAKYFMSVFPPE